MDNHAAVHEGFIILKNDDTVRGFIKLLPISWYYPVLDTGTNTIREVDQADIRFMRIYHTTPDGPFDDYFRLGYKHRIWRLIGKKGKVSLYDDALHAGPPHVILEAAGKITKLYTGMAWFMHNGGITNPALIVRFINRRYRTSVKEDDFRTTEDMYNYILEKEQTLL